MAKKNEACTLAFASLRLDVNKSKRLMVNNIGHISITFQHYVRIKLKRVV